MPQQLFTQPLVPMPSFGEAIAIDKTGTRQTIIQPQIVGATIGGTTVIGGNTIINTTTSTRSVQMVVFGFTTNVATGDGKFYLHIDPRLAGLSLVDAHAYVVTAGTTGTTDIQLHDINGVVDILSTKLTIDSGESGSDTAATSAVINTANDLAVLNRVWRVDIDAVSTTAPKGLVVTLGFAP